MGGRHIRCLLGQGRERGGEELDSGVAMLRVLMDQHNLKTHDFEEEIGGKSLVSQILNGKKNLTKNHITALSNRFHISPSLFF